MTFGFWLALIAGLLLLGDLLPDIRMWFRRFRARLNSSLARARNLFNSLFSPVR